jgi:hypothetical protein
MKTCPFVKSTFLLSQRSVLFIFMMLSWTSIHAQLIQGTVFDKDTHEAIPFASVYFSGTSLKTTCNENGNFKLPIPKGSSKPLTVSSIGYYSITMINYNSDKPLSIQLSPKVQEVSPVMVTGSQRFNYREINLPVFREEFLGKSLNAHYCNITNEGDILFSYDPEKQILKAFTYKPIHIRNQKLGYEIIYYLNEFEYNKNTESMHIEGSYIFTCDNLADKKQQYRYIKAREKAYLGSRMNFFRDLWNGKLDSTRFTVSDSKNHMLTYNQIVVEPDSTKGLKFLHYPEPLYVKYASEKKSKTKLILKKDFVAFDKTGYFDPSGISWLGWLGRLRIGDQLPYEYNLSAEEQK